MADLSTLMDPQVPEPPKDPEPELPEKFQGKSAGDIAKAYSELENKLGRQSQEIGQLRAAVTQQVTPQPTEEDFLDDPAAAVERRVQQVVAPLVEKTFVSELDRERPGWQDVVKDESFQDWVLASKARKLLLGEAQAFDLEAAQELIDGWTTRQGMSEEMVERSTEQAVQQDRKLRAAVTEGGTTRRPRGKIYKRAYVQHLKATNPREYKAQFEDIYRAYQEGRVED